MSSADACRAADQWRMHVMIFVRHDPTGGDEWPTSGSVEMTDPRDCAVFRLSGVSSDCALRLAVKFFGENPLLKIEVSASRSPSEHDWLDLKGVKVEENQMISGWQLVRVTNEAIDSAARISFAGRCVMLTHNWLPAGSLESLHLKNMIKPSSKVVSLPFDGSEGQRLQMRPDYRYANQIAQYNPLDERPMELADYTWDARSMNPSAVRASVSGYSNNKLNVHLSRLVPGQAKIILDGLPHHGRGSIRAEIIVD